MSLNQPLERMKIECFSFFHLSLSFFFWEISSWTKDQTWGPSSESTVLTTGQPGKPLKVVPLIQVSVKRTCKRGFTVTQPF